MIVGLTGQEKRLNRLGVLRKGAANPNKGTSASNKLVDLTHFRFDSEGDDALAEAFASVFGDEPNYIKGFLPYKTTDENFQAWREEYSATSMVHRCDGETIWERDASGVLYKTDVPCPYINRRSEKSACRQVGRLSLVLPDLAKAAHRFGETTIITRSYWDIASIDRCLRYYEMLAGGDLRGIPFVFSRQPRKVTVSYNGKKSKAEKWLIFIEPGPEWVRRQLEVAHAKAIGAHLEALPAPQDNEGDDEDGIIIDSDTGEVFDAPTINDSPILTEYKKTLGEALDIGLPYQFKALNNDADYAAETKAIKQHLALWERFTGPLLNAAYEVGVLEDVGDSEFDSEEFSAKFTSAEYKVLLKYAGDMAARIKEVVSKALPPEDLPQNPKAPIEDWLQVWVDKVKNQEVLF